MKTTSDFVAIGDITTDAFIRLKDAHIHTNLDEDKKEVCLSYGAKIPYESVTVINAVGNCANAAVAAARLGVSSALISNQGDDEIGSLQIKVLRNEKVSTNFITSYPGKKTNYHYVLWYGDERTILVKHEEYPYHMPDIGHPEWLYLTSLGESSIDFHAEIKQWLENHPHTKLAFQPGTFQINMGLERLDYFFKRAEVLFVNKEEASMLLKNNPSSDSITLAKNLQKISGKIAVVTDGPVGAYFAIGENVWFMPPYPDPRAPLERTGAGDAYSSTFISALALGLSPKEAMLWAPINSMSVVQKIGAREGLLNRSEIEHFLAHAPKNYKPKKV